MSVDTDIRQWEPLLASPPISFKLETQPQDQCPLFSLPAEVRTIIFKYVLTDYESTDYFYMPDRNNQDLDMRRDYRPRRSTYTQLLRACQRIYSETWLMTYILAEHISYVGQRNPGTNEDTLGDGIKSGDPSRMAVYFKVVKDYIQEYSPTFGIPHLEGIRYYVNPVVSNPAVRMKLWDRPEGKEFSPKCITFSFSYKHGWMGSQFGLNLKAKWVNKTRFPQSVTRIRMELGKFSDDPEQLREIVSQVCSKWFFRRRGGGVFRADDVEYRRWVAYEPPDGLFQWTRKTYVIPILTWKVVADFDPFAEEGYICPDLSLANVAQQGRRPLGDITRRYR
ncbi:Hypothetical protein PENO1_058100 [Penicillium occitanis (nom. inval.)]|nr:Hypothetical protein PENO1_058100 [Penicillium occitanis (nom. inval.)]PCG99327.1 hypothetical protein PENOC_058820 [Penicillium occitanis (nom. inval.)]